MARIVKARQHATPRRPRGRAALIGSLAALAAALLAALGAFDGAERRTEAWRIALATDPLLLGEPREGGSTVVLAIDDNALERYGEWNTWPRSRLAKIIDALHEAGAAAIALDVLLLTPGDPNDDAELARAIASHGKVLLAAASGRNAPLPMFAEAAAGVGAVGIDHAAADRTLTRFWRRDDAGTPTLGSAAAAILQSKREPARARRADEPIPWPQATTKTHDRSEPLWARALESQSIGQLLIEIEMPELERAFAEEMLGEQVSWPFDEATRRALEEQAAFVLEQLGTLSDAEQAELSEAELRPLNLARWWRAVDGPTAGQNVPVLHKQRFAGKIVFIGWAATGSTADRVSTPWGPQTPGVFVHAAIAEGTLSGAHIADPGPLGDTLIALALGLLCAIACATPALARGWLVVASLGVLYAGAAALAMPWFAVLLPATGPLAAGAAGALGAGGAIAQQLRRERDSIRRVLRSRVSAELERELLAGPGGSTLPADRRDVTVAFFDIAGFSSLSETAPSDALASIVNDTLGTIARAVRDSGGYVNKFLGDGLMALWNAPGENEQHAASAISAALEARRALKERSGGGASAAGVRIRVGIATGEAVVGDFGAPPELNDYTAIGAVVNDAAHLEKAAKTHGVWCLMTEATHHAANGSDAGALDLGETTLPGRTKPVRVFGIAGD